MTDTDSKPVVDVARENLEGVGDEIYAFEDGTVVKLTSIPAAVIDEVVSRVKMPEIPTWHNPENERDEQNPNDPSYIIAVQETERRRGAAMIDAVIMFGIQLVNGMPEDDAWITRLRFMEKRGQMDMSAYDLEDQMEKEFVYKRFSAPMWMITRVQELSAVSQGDISKAKRLFRGKAKG